MLTERSGVQGHVSEWVRECQGSLAVRSLHQVDVGKDGHETVSKGLQCLAALQVVTGLGRCWQDGSTLKTKKQKIVLKNFTKKP